MHEKLKILGSILLDNVVHFLWGCVVLLIPRFRNWLLSKVISGTDARLVSKEESMEKVIPISTEIAANITIAGGKLKISIEGDVDALLDKLAASIDGGIDDAIIGVLKAALKVV